MVRLGSVNAMGTAAGSRPAAWTSQATSRFASQVVRHGSTTAQLPWGVSTRTEISSQFESHGSRSSSGNW